MFCNRSLPRLPMEVMEVEKVGEPIIIRSTPGIPTRRILLAKVSFLYKIVLDIRVIRITVDCGPTSVV